jgi:hypothetical protein
MALEIISEVETILSIVKMLQALVKTGAVQEDLAGLVSDAAQLKVLFDDVKSKLNSVVDQLDPEIKVLIQSTPAKALSIPVLTPPVVAPSS